MSLFRKLIVCFWVGGAIAMARAGGEYEGRCGVDHGVTVTVAALLWPVLVPAAAVAAALGEGSDIDEAGCLVESWGARDMGEVWETER